MRYAPFSILIVLLLGQGAMAANNFCFAVAETYYEQVYCQLQAKAQLKNLPPFHQFQKNNEQVQYSLLKRPAERNAIKLAPPVKKLAPPSVELKAPASSAFKSEPAAAVLRSINADTVEVSRPNSPRDNSFAPDLSRPDLACELIQRQIHCDNRIYELLGNRANHRLAAQVLESHNTMALPNVGANAVGLTAAYEKYISKMCEIGLCGVTMTYRKFAYLYQDLQSKGLDFTQRFETMFSFLKKDKASMAVSESINLPATVTLADCSELGSQYYVCDAQGKNYIFARR
jgi:hypothetical protein